MKKGIWRRIFGRSNIGTIRTISIFGVLLSIIAILQIALLLRDLPGASEQIPLLGDKEIVRKRLNLESWVSLNSLPRLLIDAIVIREDARFFRHAGTDPEEMKNAFFLNLKSGSFRYGASTITQQMVRNVLLDRKKTIARKLTEIILAVRVERRLTKYEILEIYFNVAEFFPETRGVAAGAERYFGKQASSLTPSECLFMAWVLPNPKRGRECLVRGSLSWKAKKGMGNLLDELKVGGLLESRSLVYGTYLYDSVFFAPADGNSRIERVQ